MSLDVRKVVNQPYSGDYRLLMEWMNKLRQEFIANLVTLKSIKNYEKVVVYDREGALYIGRLAGIDPTNLNVFLVNALNIRGNYVVSKVLVRGDVVKRIEYVTDSELRSVLDKVLRKEKKP